MDLWTSLLLPRFEAGLKRDLENHIRGLLKNLGLVIGRAKFNVFAVRAEELTEGRPEVIAAIRPLLEARNAVEQQVSDLDRKVMKLVRRDAQVRRFMTVPGVGPITAAGTMAMVSSSDFLRAPERPTAIATLNRQRHLTPSCGGLTPTAERTVGPARMIVGELDTQTRN